MVASRALLTAAATLSLATACAPAVGTYDGRFQLAPLPEAAPAAPPEAPPPVAPVAVPAAAVAAPTAAGASAGEDLVLDLTALVTQLRGRRLLAVWSDVHRLVVTIVTSDGLVHTQALEQADLAAGRFTLTFTALAVGAASLRVDAQDAGGAVLKTVDQAIVVGGKRQAPLPVQLPLADAPSSGGGGSSGPPDPPPPPDDAPADLALSIRIDDAPDIPYAPLPKSWLAKDLVTGDGRKPHAGSSFDLLFGAGGDAYTLRNTRERFDPQRWDVSPGPTYDLGTGEILRVGTDGTLRDVWSGINARSITTAPDGTLWAAIWPKELRHLDAAGATVATAAVTGNVALRGVAVDATQAWIAHGSAIARFTHAGAQVGQTLLPGVAGAVAKDRATGALWAVAGNRVVKLSAAGAIQRTSPVLSPFAENPYARLAVAPDGSVWVTHDQLATVTRLNPDGTIAARRKLLGVPLDVAIAPDGAALVSQAYGATTEVGRQAGQFGVRGVLRLGPDAATLAGWWLAENGYALAVAGDGAIWAAGLDLTRFVP